MSRFVISNLRRIGKKTEFLLRQDCSSFIPFFFLFVQLTISIVVAKALLTPKEKRETRKIFILVVNFCASRNVKIYLLTVKTQGVL